MEWNYGWRDFREDIKNVNIDTGITTISNGAFDSCVNIVSVKIPNSVKLIDSGAFAECYSLTNVTIPNSVEEISNGAFWDCVSLENIEIPNGVKTIGDSAFGACQGLKSVKIPSSVDEIGANSFSFCTSLVEVHVDEGNPSYCSEDDVLFNKEKSCLICYPIGKSDARYVVPDGVTEIADCAFADSSNLIEIQIPKSVTYIDFSAFADCDRLSDVYYEGNETEWSAIIIDDNNEPLTSATIHYNS